MWNEISYISFAFKISFLLEIFEKVTNELNDENDELDRDYLQVVEVDLDNFQFVLLVAEQTEEVLTKKLT